MDMRINTQEDFQRWAKVQMALRGINSRKLAGEIGLPETRISEALHGKGKRYVTPIIIALGGDPEKFKKVI